MKRSRITWTLGAALLIAVGAGRPAHAAGFDLAAAIRSAAPGATIDVPAGTQRGPFIVDKPLRLHGSSGAILDGGGTANVVEIRAPDVELAGFVIRNSSSDIAHDRAGVYVAAPRATIRDNTIVDCLHGIYLKAVTDARILRNVIRGRGAVETVADPIVSGLKLSPDELCSSALELNQRGNGIHLWKSLRIEIADNDIRGTRDGIYFSFSDQTQVRRNRISQVRYGLHYMYSDENLFEENTFADNAAGAALMFSADIVLRGNRFTANRSQRSYGLLLHTVDRTVIENNVVEGNTVGLYLESNNTNTVRNNEIAGNYIGLRISDSSGDNTFAGNNFVRNVHPVEMSGPSEGNHWTSAGRGNHWDGALALDLNHDGIADVPHREVDVFGSWRREFPAIGLLSGSPGERLIRFIYSRVPVRGLLGVTDARPLVRARAP